MKKSQLEMTSIILLISSAGFFILAFVGSKYISAPFLEKFKNPTLFASQMTSIYETVIQLPQDYNILWLPANCVWRSDSAGKGGKYSFDCGGNIFFYKENISAEKYIDAASVDLSFFCPLNQKCLPTQTKSMWLDTHYSFVDISADLSYTECKYPQYVKTFLDTNDCPISTLNTINSNCLLDVSEWGNSPELKSMCFSESWELQADSNYYSSLIIRFASNDIGSAGIGVGYINLTGDFNWVRWLVSPDKKFRNYVYPINDYVKKIIIGSPAVKNTSCLDMKKWYPGNYEKREVESRWIQEPVIDYLYLEKCSTNSFPFEFIDEQSQICAKENMSDLCFLKIEKTHFGENYQEDLCADSFYNPTTCDGSSNKTGISAVLEAYSKAVRKEEFSNNYLSCENGNCNLTYFEPHTYLLLSNNKLCKGFCGKNCENYISFQDGSGYCYFNGTSAPCQFNYFVDDASYCIDLLKTRISNTTDVFSFYSAHSSENPLVILSGSTISLDFLNNQVQFSQGTLPIASWNFDGNLNDSINDNHPIEEKNTAFSQGKFRNALELKGDGYIKINEIEMSDELSITAWIKLNPDEDKEFIFSNSRDSNTPFGGYSLGILNNTLAFYISDSDSRSVVVSSTIIDTNWHYVTAVYNKGNVKLYIDNILDKEQTILETSISEYSHTTHSYIGILAYEISTGWYKFNGIIDELKIYNRALSQQEIKTQSRIKSDYANNLITAGTHILGTLKPSQYCAKLNEYCDENVPCCLDSVYEGSYSIKYSKCTQNVCKVTTE